MEHEDTEHGDAVKRGLESHCADDIGSYKYLKAQQKRSAQEGLVLPVVVSAGGALEQNLISVAHTSEKYRHYNYADRQALDSYRGRVYPLKDGCVVYTGEYRGVYRHSHGSLISLL